VGQIEQRGVLSCLCGISTATFFGVTMAGHSAVSWPLPNSMKLTGTPKKPAMPKVS
jgi:hypothetical protein